MNQACNLVGMTTTGVVNRVTDSHGGMMEARESTNPRGDCDSSSFTGDDDLRAQVMARPEISPSTGNGKFLLLKGGRKDVLLSA